MRITRSPSLCICPEERSRKWPTQMVGSILLPLCVQRHLQVGAVELVLSEKDATLDEHGAAGDIGDLGQASRLVTATGLDTG